MGFRQDREERAQSDSEGCVISISSLIYRSTKYADAVVESLREFTPHLHDHRARFFFVANDAEQKVLDHLKAKNYPHVVQTNEVLTDEELKELGFTPPEYMRRVYQGYNRAIQESDDIVVLVNSDHMFSPGWLDSLLDKASPKRIVCSKLVERSHPRFGRFPRAFEGNFGSSPDNFDREGFLKFCEKVSEKNTIEYGGAYMPCLFDKSQAVKVGMYPEGNNGKDYADKVFFQKMSFAGVEHITAMGSLVYHFKEGEKDE